MHPTIPGKVRTARQPTPPGLIRPLPGPLQVARRRAGADGPAIHPCSTERTQNAANGQGHHRINEPGTFLGMSLTRENLPLQQPRQRLDIGTPMTAASPMTSSAAARANSVSPNSLAMSACAHANHVAASHSP